MRTLSTVTLLSLTLALVAAAASTARAGDDLQPPVRLEAGGEPMDCDVGHAAPFAHDWDGDGLWDLLVGQMGGGKLRIYRNVGTATEPRFEDYVVFKAGEAEGTVPSG